MKNWITISNDFIIEEIEWIRRDSVIDFEKIEIIVVDDYDWGIMLEVKNIFGKSETGEMTESLKNFNNSYAP